MKCERNNTLLTMLGISSEVDCQLLIRDSITSASDVAVVLFLQRRKRNDYTEEESHVCFTADPVIHISSLLEILSFT